MGINWSNCKSIVWDSAPLIYYMEEHQQYVDKLQAILDNMADHKILMEISLISYIEVLVGAERSGDHRLADRYRYFFQNSLNINLHSISLPIAEQAINFRAKYSFKVPDSIQLALAHICGADHFLTNDRRLKQCREVSVLLVDEL